MKSFQLGKLALEGITVGTFLLRRIGFMCSHMDPFQRAVIHISRMVHAVVDRTLNAVILFLIHHFRSPPFAFQLFSRLPGDTMPAARMVLFCADSGKNMIGKTEKSGNKKSGNRKAGNRKVGNRKAGKKKIKAAAGSNSSCSSFRDLSGNRTRVYAVRGRRLDRLTNRPYLISSRRQDSNLRPLRPERSALPN